MKSQPNESESKLVTLSSHLAAKAQRILEYADGALSPADARLIQEHLQRCPECQAFHQSALQLNARLEHGIKCNDLSASFAARLWQRIDSTEEIGAAHLQQKQRMQMEFEQYSAQLRKQLFRLPNLLDIIAYSIAILMACYLVVSGFEWFTGILRESWPSLGEHSWLVLCGFVTVASLAVGLIVGLKNQPGLSSEEI